MGVLFYVDDANTEREVKVGQRVYRGRWSQLVTTLRDVDDSMVSTAKASERLLAFAKKLDRGFWLGTLKPNPNFTRSVVQTKNGLPRVWVTRAARARAIELGAKPMTVGSNLWQTLLTQRHY